MFAISKAKLSRAGMYKFNHIVNNFLDNVKSLGNIPLSQNHVRFYVIDWDDIGNQGLINAALFGLNKTNQSHTGGTWLGEMFDDEGITYAIAAVWWI